MNDKVESRQNNYKPYARDFEKWRKRNSYYHNYIRRILKFNVLKGSNILEIGCRDGWLLSDLKPKYGVGINSNPDLIKMNTAKYLSENLKFICANIEKDEIDEDVLFDYIILNGTCGEVEDIQLLLIKIVKFCNPDTRLIIIQYNPIWETILKFG